jgi:TPP-dependent 2-oxoacid decarboxylase
MGLGPAKPPKGARFHNQTLWGAIGWATPAAFGAAIGAPDRRTVLVTGEGSHQLTAQEVGQFHRHGLKPIIFLLNNNGYLIERSARTQTSTTTISRSGITTCCRRRWAAMAGSRRASPPAGNSTRQ